jgi:hypothetical protein
MMNELSAEWAQWGKNPEDDGFRLLCSSGGAITPDNFNQVITRYSPGTLDSGFLPQATFAWLPGDELGTDYVALAIHSRRAISDESAGMGDAAAPGAPLVRRNRQFVLTSYYCVPFADLAAGRVSYPALYETFRLVPLPVPEGKPATAWLAAAPGPGLQVTDQAMKVAALLLTDRPVCILGAGGLDIGTRLAFIEMVAGLLPYGIRSRLSAATWTSSTARRHRYRLFFARTPRSREDHREDHVVNWHDATLTATGDPRADGYLSWLRLAPEQRMATLLGDTQPTGFHPDEVRAMFGRLGIAGLLPRLALPSSAGRDPGRRLSVPALLVAASQSLDDPGALRGCVKGLREHLGMVKSPREREEYQQIMAEHRLLRAGARADRGVLAEFYDVVLALAFPGVLTYEDYCHIESCADAADGALHLSLLLAISRHSLEEHVTYPLIQVLLWLDKSVTSGDRPLPGMLVALAAQPSLAPRHAVRVYDLLREVLEDEADTDPAEVQEALAVHRYLAATMERQLPDARGYQVWILGELIGFAFRRPLGKADVEHIRACADPGSLALDAALLLSHESGEQLRRGLAGAMSSRSGRARHSRPPTTVAERPLAGLAGLKQKLDDAQAESRPWAQWFFLFFAFLFLVLVIGFLLARRH